jgi:hypothetical protein
MLRHEITKPGMKLPCYNQLVLVGLLIFCLCALPVHANVYATDIRLNGSLQAGVIVPNCHLTISYILNDTATGGVCVRICDGATVIKTFPSAGTNVGLNSVVWDGSTGDDSPLAQGIYTVSITAASTGYDTWTSITDDGTNFSVAVPTGISVNQNTNSPYYGRVFVSDANGPFGIFKRNADGSPGDEGCFSSGGLTWGEGHLFSQFSPWKIAISAADKVYIDDFSENGVVYEFDQTISANCGRVAIGTDNYPTQDASPQLSGLAVTGTGTNTQIWMTDANYPDQSAGIVVWQAATNGVAAPDDTGMVVAPIDQSFLSVKPYDLALDTNDYIYAVQFLYPSDKPAYVLMQFPPYQGEPETNANWGIGMENSALLGTSGVAVDPTGTNVALAVFGTGDNSEDSTGGLYIYNTTSADLINIDQTGGHAYYDAAWDNVGNVYALDGTTEVWRAYSPPGTNQATTVAVPIIQAYSALLPPTLCNPMVDMDGLRFTLAGQSNIIYVISNSCDLVNWTAAATNFSTNANRCIRFPLCGTQNFYCAATSAP